MTAIKVRVVKNACYGYYKNESGRVVECNQREISTNSICSKCGEYKTDITGDVIYKNKYFMVVQGGNYRECFLLIDIANGDYILDVIERGKQFAGKKNRKQAKLGFAQFG